MTVPHVFVETNFLFGVCRLPSERHRDALALRSRFEAGEVKLYVPYLCFQEASNLIGQKLPTRRGEDLLEFHRFAVEQGFVAWDFEEVKKLRDAALAEVSKTKAVYKRELADFATALGDGVLHASDEVFDLLESLDLDGDNLTQHPKWIIDLLILCSVLVKAKHLQAAGISSLYFASLDKKAFEPTVARPKLTRYYNEVGLIFLPQFVLPDVSSGS